MSRLHGYLRRIAYGGPMSPSLQTLRALHRAHLRAIPYENIDVQLGRSVQLDVDRTYEKIVTNRRGGWCYEMNGLFAWALREMGFTVELLGAGVNEHGAGPNPMMAHAVLRVNLDVPYLADVGFGNGFFLPLPLREGTHTDGLFEYRLERTAEGWRFHNQAQTDDGYEFTEQPFAFDDFEEMCAWQQTSSDSSFVQNLVCHRYTDEGVTTLRGAVLRTYTPRGTHDEIAQSKLQLAEILDRHFDLRPPEIDELWEHVAERHKAWLKKKLRGF